MISLDEILKIEDVPSKITLLKNRSFAIPSWETLVKEYEPTFHEIVHDKKGRKDKIHSDGSVDKAARIPIGLEKLLVKRMTEFTFSIPVKREYSYEDGDVRRAVANAIEKIYEKAHIDSENIKRGQAYYASCEIFTMWYAVPKKNELYGFESTVKLKCKTFSPMDRCQLYPLIDDLGDMLAMSFEYEKKSETGATMTTYFETFTEDSHFKWKRDGDDGVWTEAMNPEPIKLLKIPGAYLWRPFPVYHGLSSLREDLEYSISRNSDTIAYNASPVLKVSGTIIGDENKGESRRVYRVENGGDVSYVSWAQSNEALKYHIDSLLKFFWMQAQMPDISFDNMKSLGNIGYDSRRTLLTDAHLKIGEESGPWKEFFNRECNVIKAFLKKMKPEWSKEIDKVEVEHVITPFIIEDEQAKLDYHMKANGGKPVESQQESIQRIGKSQNVEETIRQINNEDVLSLKKNENMESIFSSE